MANSNLIYREVLQKHYSTQWKGITISSGIFIIILFLKQETMTVNKWMFCKHCKTVRFAEM